MEWITGRPITNNNNNNPVNSVNPVNPSVSNPYNKNNIFPNLRQKTNKVNGVNPKSYLSRKILKSAQNIRNKNKAAMANRNANRFRLLNQYASTRTPRTRKNRRTRRR